jgi:CDP-ribitol ribitolphosphotransferase
MVRNRLRTALGEVRGALFRLALRGIKAVAGRSGRRVLFTSDSRAGLTGNLKDVHDRMVLRGLDRGYRLQTLFKEGVAGRRMVDRLRMPWLLAAADVIVIDDFQPVIYRIGVDPSVRIVQLWHASGAFKTVGYSRVGKPGGPDPYSRVHKNYTHAIVSSEHDIPFYAEAFGIPESRVVPTGIPRMDRFFDEAARTAGLEAARAAFPQIAGRMTILFAPTFRGDGPRTATYDIAGLDYAALHRLCVERDAVIIIRMHPFVTEPLAIPEPFRDRLLDGSADPLDVNDLLFAVDLLVTDYSSIVFEYSTLGRPMLFYAYDLEEYTETRDFYESFETFVPGRIVRTFPELLAAIARDDYEVEKVAAFAARHFAHLDGGSTDRVIDQLILGR